MTIRLVLAGEPSMVRDGVRSLLTAEDDFELVGEAADHGETIHALHRSRPDVLLVDENTLAEGSEGEGSGGQPDLIEAAALGGIRIVVMADRFYPLAFLRAVNVGASGYLLKGDGTGSLLAAIRAAAGGDAWFSPPAARHLLDQYRGRSGPETDGGPADGGPAYGGPAYGGPADGGPDQLSGRGSVLSGRELSVIQLLATGRSNAEIAKDLGLALSTVKTHVSRILTKLELRDRLQLAAFAHQNDLV